MLEEVITFITLCSHLGSIFSEEPAGPMEPITALRKKHVQVLRKVARATGLQLVRDDAAQERVSSFAQAIESSAATEKDKRLARAAFTAYQATWASEEAPAPSVGQQAPADDGGANGFRLRGESFLLTYNWDFFNEPMPDGTAPPSDPAELWKLWVEWKATKKKELKVRQSTSKMERSLRSKDFGRVHLHWKTNLKNKLDNRSTGIFAFHGIKPDVRPTVVDKAAALAGKKARGASFQQASNRGHFYAWAPKRGTLYRGTNYKPFEDYRVLGQWIDDLWTDHKLDHETYQALALRVRVGYSARKRNLDQVIADEREARIDARLKRVEGELNKLKAPPRFFPEVRVWEDSFLRLDFRWRLLLLWADSASGKSTYAEGLLRNPYLLTVEESEYLDLRGFDFETNDGIVLDNVNSFSQLLKWRAILQGRNTKSKGGQSATNVYAYTQCLFGVAVVATVDLDAPDGYLLDKASEYRSKWLVKNTVLVQLPRGETFYDQRRKPTGTLENPFSLFAKTVTKRRLQGPAPEPPRVMKRRQTS